MRLLRTLLVLLGALATASPALAHSDPDHVKSTSQGMLSFIASTGLATPVHLNAYDSPITVSADSDHFVAVSAMGGGGSLSIDYRMALTSEGAVLGNAMGQTNKSITLDGTGYWEQAWNAGTRSATLAAGGRVTGSEAWIHRNGDISTLATALHTHNITVN